MTLKHGKLINDWRAIDYYRAGREVPLELAAEANEFKRMGPEEKQEEIGSGTGFHDDGMHSIELEHSGFK